MRNLMIFFCISISVFCFTKGFSQALSKDSVKIPKCYWYGGGTGISSLGSLSVGMDLNAEISNRWLIAVSGIGEISSLQDDSFKQKTDVTTVGVSAGKIFKQKFSLITLSAGLGYLNIHTRDSEPGVSSRIYHDRYRNTIGIPISIDGYLVGLQALGLGIGGYVNLNTIQTTAGVRVKLAIGRLATHERKVKA